MAAPPHTPVNQQRQTIEIYEVNTESAEKQNEFQKRGTNKTNNPENNNVKPPAERIKHMITTIIESLNKPNNRINPSLAYRQTKKNRQRKTEKCVVKGRLGRMWCLRKFPFPLPHNNMKGDCSLQK